MFIVPLVAMLLCGGLGLFAPGPRRQVPLRTANVIVGCAVALLGAAAAALPFSVDWAVMIASAGVCVIMLAVWLCAPPRLRVQHVQLPSATPLTEVPDMDDEDWDRLLRQMNAWANDR